MSSDNSALVKLLGPKLISPTGEEIAVASLEKSKTAVAIYFSASWCPPCRAFSPKLSEAYADYKKRPDGDDLELVFVSSDSDVDSFNAYHKKMTFPALPFDRRDLKASLSDKFDVRGIPTLVVIDSQGNQIHKDDEGVDLRSLVMQHGGAAFPFSKERLSKLEDEAKAKQAIALKSLVDPSLDFAVEPPGQTDATIPLSELLAKNDFVSFLLGDGDYSDANYKQAETLFQGINSKKPSSVLPIYVGWSTYNEQSDHTKFKDQFHSLTSLTKEQKSILESIVGETPTRVPMVVTIRRGSGLCYKDGACEEADLPLLVSVDPMMRNVLVFGSPAFPWDAEALEAATKAKKDRLESLKLKMADFEILRSEQDENTLISNGTKCTVEDLVAMGDEGVVGLYFSAHWCGPCRFCTPELVKCYEAVKAAGKKFEIVFVSSDTSKQEFEEYFASMKTEAGGQWFALDYDQRDLKKDLGEIFEVEGIPTLILMKKDGTIITRDGAQRALRMGPDSFPWDDEAIERKKKLSLQKEADVLEKQLTRGGMVLKRLIGSPGTIDHDLSERCLTFGDGFATMGAPESVTKSGAMYYEIEIVDIGQPVVQFGFGLAGDMADVVDHENGLGVGDNDKSWAVDGYRGQRWHNETPSPFGCSWYAGDVIGLAVNVEAGKIAVSRNGSWSKNDNCGVVFHSDSISSSDVFPAFSAGTANKVRYNMEKEHFKYAPPPEDVWEQDA